jgi:hypothetical protein
VHVRHQKALTISAPGVVRPVSVLRLVQIECDKLAADLLLLGSLTICPIASSRDKFNLRGTLEGSLSVSGLMLCELTKTAAAAPP